MKHHSLPHECDPSLRKLVLRILWEQKIAENQSLLTVDWESKPTRR
jgi:hypothetical protein